MSRKKKKTTNWTELIVSGLIDLIVGFILYLIAKYW